MVWLLAPFYMKIVYMDQKEAKDIEHLRRSLVEGIEVTIIAPEEKDKLISQAPEFHGIIGAGIPREFLEKAENLKYVIIPFAGIPKNDKEVLSDYPYLTVVNSHFNKGLVAEHAWALLLASARRLCSVHEKLKKGDWSPRYEHHMGVGLEGKCLLIIGYGAVGKEIARIGKAFNMIVKAVNKSGGDGKDIDHLGTDDELHGLLPEADFIVVALPLTDETEGFLGSEEFQCMKEGVHLVNIGRGPVIDEEAFYQALNTGKLGGAAIDTWWIYPPDEESRTDTFPSKYPLDRFDNLVFSPHRSTHVEDRERMRMNDLACILNDLYKGKERNVVDLEKGY